MLYRGERRSSDAAITDRACSPGQGTGIARAEAAEAQALTMATCLLANGRVAVSRASEHVVHFTERQVRWQPVQGCIVTGHRRKGCVRVTRVHICTCSLCHVDTQLCPTVYASLSHRHM